MQNEIWKDVPGNDRYKVSTNGNVYSVYLKRNMTICDRGNGYMFVGLCNKGERKYAMVHRLVAMAFIPNPDGHTEIDHINGNKADNRVENLRWVKHIDNMNNPATIGARMDAIRAKQGKPIIAFKDGKKIGEYSCMMDAARALNLFCTNICKQLKGKSKTVKGYTFEYAK